MNDYKDLLGLFFSRAYEIDVNEKILDDKEFVVPKDRLLSYIMQIVKIPYKCFLEYIRENEFLGILKSPDITQSSAFESCEIRMCEVLINEDNPGLKYAEIGALFPEKVKEKNEISFRKYGENQIKTSQHLGLAFEYYNYWYLNCLGYVYLDLTEDLRKSLLARTILRNNLYNRIINDLILHDIKISDYLECLSYSTKIRRIHSVEKLLNICLNECVLNNIDIHTVIPEVLSRKVPGIKLNPVGVEKPIFQNDDEALDYYIFKFKNLNCAKKGGKLAPHKPILLISIIKMIQVGLIQNNKIELTFELYNVFNRYAKLYTYDKELFKPNIGMPFIHLQNDGFWNLKPKIQTSQVGFSYSWSRLRLLYDYAILDQELFDLLRKSEYREVLKDILEHHFLK